jgi:DNA polymerase III delta subunit
LGEVPPGMQSWQVRRLKAQASRWEAKSLLDFYEKLLSIEVQLKTGRSVYTVGESLTLLSCYYL